MCVDIHHYLSSNFSSQSQPLDGACGRQSHLVHAHLRLFYDVVHYGFHVSGFVKHLQLPVGAGAHFHDLPFFGGKAQIEGAFHTRIHLFAAAGEQHYANVSAPLIPVSLASAITVIRGLNDFHPRPGVHVPRGVTPARAHLNANSSLAPDTYYSGSNLYPGYVGPTDFAIMYNLSPEYQLGITGAGVTVAIAAQSDLDSSVLPTFWSGFGVAGSSFGLPAQQFSSIAVPAS